jgi:hypothetical protein
VEQRNAYLRAREEQKKERDAKELELEDLIQSKLDGGEDPTTTEQELVAFRAQPDELKETPSLTVKREFVLCVDTLG